MRLPRAILIPKKPSKTLFELSALENIIDLLKAGLSLSQSLNLLESYDDKFVGNIIKRMQKGENAKEVFGDFLPRNIRSYYEALISYLSFGDALELAINTFKKERSLKEQLIKDLAYPLGMLGFSLLGIYFFNIAAFEPLIMSVSQFQSDLSALYIFKNALDIFINIVFGFIALFLLMGLYYKRPSHKVRAYILLVKHLKDSIIKDYLSSRFVMYLSECHKSGLKTKDSISILKSLKSEPLISFIAFHVEEAFLKGKSYDEALSNPFLDKKLAKVINIALLSGKFDVMIENYLKAFRTRFKKCCKKYAKILQIISYVIIGIIIVFVYQILFIPMSAIGGLT